MCFAASREICDCPCVVVRFVGDMVGGESEAWCYHTSDGKVLADLREFHAVASGFRLKLFPMNSLSKC